MTRGSELSESTTDEADKPAEHDEKNSALVETASKSKSTDEGSDQFGLVIGSILLQIAGVVLLFSPSLVLGLSSDVVALVVSHVDRSTSNRVRGHN